jgi:hypothetical protein
MSEEILLKKIISIRSLKLHFSKQFPANMITKIFLNEPDEMSIEAFISKTGTWLALLDLEKQQVFNSSIQNSMEAEK